LPRKLARKIALLDDWPGRDFLSIAVWRKKKNLHLWSTFFRNLFAPHWM